MAPLRVLHICEAFDPGGVVWWLADVTPLVPREIFAFDFHCCGTHPGVRAGEVRRLGCTVTLFRPTLREVIFGQQLRRVLRSRSYDMVHAHMFNLSGWLLRVAAQEGVPWRIAHFHNTSDGRPDGVAARVRRAVGRAMVRRYANAILACSVPALQLAPIPRRAAVAEVLPYGIDLAKFSEEAQKANRTLVRREWGVSPEARVIIHVGRFYPQKNHLFLLEVFARVLSYERDTVLVLVGDGPLRRVAEQRVQELGLHHCVRFLGNRLNVAPLLAGADVFCFPSLYEGLGIAVVEARQAGLPVVASDLESVRSAVEGSGLGYTLVPQGDRDGFVTALLAFVRERRRFPPEPAWAHKFSREASTSRLLAIYSRLVGATR